MELITVSIVISAFLIGLSTGANDAANAIGLLVGSNTMRFRRAAILVSLLVIIGAILQGQGVIKTVGKGILPSITNNPNSNNVLILAALLSTLLLVGIMTVMAFPISTTHAIIGSIVGAGIAAGLFHKINFITVYEIVVSWLLTPAATIILAIIIYALIIAPLSTRMGIIQFNRIFQVILLFGTFSLAYSVGANNIGNVAGPLIIANILDDTTILAVLFGISMGLGTVFFSRKVVFTVGNRITAMGPVLAFTSQFSAGLVIYIFTLLGIPVSSTQAVIGGILGVGMLKGTRSVDKKTIEYIFLGWILTPVISAILSMLAYAILSSVL
ncbi:MAG TPA: inorganic phosphate transporter [Candidatus Altiarchaeales archaeon]|nr:inorganic phosphate transporter [Candidatus Altiarchaeales archaeon]